MSSQTTATAAPTEHRILRRAEVEAKTGFKRAHIYSLMKEGKFPKALRLGVRAVGWDRSEEHTSELQSLMRNSYAVFCLKQKNEPDYLHPTKAANFNKRQQWQ